MLTVRYFWPLVFEGQKESLGTLIRGVPYDLKVMASSCEISHGKEVRPPTIHPSGCGPFPDLAYTGRFVHRTVLLDLAFMATKLILVLKYLSNILNMVSTMFKIIVRV